MKATVLVRLKGEVLDPQGDAIRRALGTMGFDGVGDVRVGKLIEIDVQGQTAATLKPALEKMADQLFANPVIEDFEVRVES